MNRATSLALLALGAFGCAQSPTAELALVGARVEAARSGEAAIYAPALLEEAEAALSEAERLAREERAYRAALRVAVQASLTAEDALASSLEARGDVRRRLGRLEQEIQSLLLMAGSRGARDDAPGELESFRERWLQIRAIAGSGDLLGALDEAARLKPELVAFEQRFR